MPRSRSVPLCGLTLVLLLTGGAAYAGSAAWLLFPASGDWNASGNWTPATVPNGAADTATFEASNITAVSLSSNTQLNGIIFGGNAAFTPYTISTPPAGTFNISGVGITNNSGVTQNFVTTVSGAFRGVTNFSNSASAGALTSFTAIGGEGSGFDGGTIQFNDTSTAGLGAFIANGGTVEGAQGGIISFKDSATAGNGAFTNKPGVVSGGHTQFAGLSTALNGSFDNLAGTIGAPAGGFTRFTDSSTAGSGTFLNRGDANASTTGGFTEFFNTSSAGNASFTNRNATGYGGVGSTYFNDSSTAGSGAFFNIGSALASSIGGNASFRDSSTAGNAAFVNFGGTASFATGGVTFFGFTSTAGNGTFTNNGGTVNDANGGVTQFNNAATAGNASFTNEPGAVYKASGGATQFNNTATAGAAILLNKRGATGEERGGRTQFFGTSDAGMSTITNEGGGGVAFAAGDSRGSTEFRATSTAGAATITNSASVTRIGLGGSTHFFDGADAGTATVINEGGAIATGNGGSVHFDGTSSGGSATIINRGAAVTSGGQGTTWFSGTSAGNATIINESGTGENGSGGFTVFENQATGADAGSSTITNKAPTSAQIGGVTSFSNSSAATAKITAEGSSIAGESVVVFAGTSTAADSTIAALGATGAAGLGGRVLFNGTTTAGNATLTATSGEVDGAPGGRFVFEFQSDGGTASATIEASATFDMSGLVNAGMAIGSIQGTGTYFLGSKRLTVGGNNASTTAAGVIADGGLSGGAGGALTKVGAGTLTLSGANTYTGATNVNAGTLAVDGSIPGTVMVNSSATLAGNGTVGGLVTVASGGILSPGNSPGTLTVGMLTLESGSFTEIELAGTENDQVNVVGSAALDGTLALALINDFVPSVGDRFTIMTYGSRNGTFASILGRADTPGVFLSEIYRANDLILLTTAPGEKTWGVDASGDVSVGANWIGGVAPGGVGEAAAFTTIITAPRTVTIDAPLTLGTMRFDDDDNYTLAGPNTITLQNSGATRAAINVLNLHGNGQHTISAPIMVASDLDIVQNSAGELTLSGGLATTVGRTITKTGPGTLSIAGLQSYGIGAQLSHLAGTLNLLTDAGGGGANLSLDAQSAVNFTSSQHLAALQVGPGTTAVLSAGGGKVLATRALTIAADGRLDLTDNDFVLHSTAANRLADAAAIRSLLAGGFAAFGWNGPGIASSAAATDPALLTALGMMLNDDGLGGPYRATFSGEPVDANSVLVKYTYYGDADLSGAVDGTDYALIDNGFNAGLSDWFNGDFDYSGIIDGTDYALIDNAFNNQTGPLAAGPIGPHVPEPSSWALALLGICLVAAGNRGYRRAALARVQPARTAG